MTPGVVTLGKVIWICYVGEFSRSADTVRHSHHLALGDAFPLAVPDSFESLLENPSGQLPELSSS